MKTKFRVLGGVAFLWACCSAPGWAGFEDGLNAYNSGNFSHALFEWRLLADQGDVRAQNNLGVMYANGHGVKKDNAMAAQWYRKAAEMGDVSAQFNLGVLYSEGKGVMKDERMAAFWYGKAADQGDMSAQYNLGVLYGSGVEAAGDVARAAFWMAKSAQQGNEQASETLTSLLPKLAIMYIAKPKAKVYSERSPKTVLVATLPKNFKVYILDKQEDWSQVYLSEGHALGWIEAANLKLFP